MNIYIYTYKQTYIHTAPCYYYCSCFHRYLLSIILAPNITKFMAWPGRRIVTIPWLSFDEAKEEEEGADGC